MRAIVLGCVALALLATCRGTAPPPKPVTTVVAPPPAPPPAPVAVLAAAPGPLTTSHAAVGCNDCHVNNTKVISSQKCIACHRALGQRMAAGKGFHSTASVRGKECVLCHLDHRGASYDNLGWDNLVGGAKHFDHKLAGWELTGKHATTDCVDCHPNPKTFTADRLCGACHMTDQPHGFVLRPMLACERCHTTAVWAPARMTMQFDHNDRKDAAFPIVGKHADVVCSACHPRARFHGADPKTTCLVCHPKGVP